MANKQLFRSALLQILFSWDIRNFSQINREEDIDYLLRAFSPALKDEKKNINLFAKNILKKKELIDEIIEKAARGWTLNRMNIIDRNVLRIGMYELVFGDKEIVPERVAMNEAIELAKKFSGGKSGQFINGVMGAVYRELGEPGKDFVPKKKYDDIPLEDMEIDKKGAAVVYSVDKQGVLRIGMVHDIFGYWTLSKGGIEEGEDVQEGTIREVKEETNWDIQIEAELGENEYIAYHPERGPVRKQVTYFLGKTPYTKPVLEKGSGGLDAVRWFDLSEIGDLNIYDDVSRMLTKAIKIILEEEVDIDDEKNIDITEKKGVKKL